MIRKPADDLVVRLAKIHDEGIENVLQDYINEYATYAWDDICEKLANINAQIDLLMMELKYAQVRNEENVWRF